MGHRQVRRAFLDYFVNNQGHTLIPSSSVIPNFTDKSCLFVNAGMFQFKTRFLDSAQNGLPLRVANTQKCIRAGGKHNDLENAGVDGYHHTFFEMLGNWSFGDYFRVEACQMALDLLINVYRIPMSRLYFSYFNGNSEFAPDIETKDCWIELGVPRERIIGVRKNVPVTLRTSALARHGIVDETEENFWEMGATGPCGPCTEIYYDKFDRGLISDVNTNIPGLEEIWNIVLIQYNRLATNELRPLLSKHIDTGIGFERLLALLEGVNDNYETSLFAPLREYLEDASGLKMNTLNEEQKIAFYMCLDHIRCLTVALSDGAEFTRGDRGPILKRIMKRLIWFSLNILKITEIDIKVCVDLMSEIYDGVFPEIGENQTRTIEILEDQRAKALVALRRGEEDLKKRKKLDGITPKTVWLLHESKGLPMEITRRICQRENISLDWNAVENFVALSVTPSNPKLSSDNAKYQLSHLSNLTRQSLGDVATMNRFRPNADPPLKTRISCIFRNGELVERLSADEDASIVLTDTNLIPAVSGHASDQGSLKVEGNIFDIHRVETEDNLVFHHGTMTSGELRTSDEGDLHMDWERHCKIGDAHLGFLLYAFTLAHTFRVPLSELQLTDSKIGPDRFVFSIGGIKPFEQLHIVSVTDIEETVRKIVTTGDPRRTIDKKFLRAVRPHALNIARDVSPELQRIFMYPVPEIPLRDIRQHCKIDDSEESPETIIGNRAFRYPTCISWANINLTTAMRHIYIIDYVAHKKNNVHKFYGVTGELAKTAFEHTAAIHNQLERVYSISSQKERVKEAYSLTRHKLLPYVFKQSLMKNGLGFGRFSQIRVFEKEHFL